MVFVKTMQKPKSWYFNCFNVVPPPFQFKWATWSKDANDGTVASFNLCCNLTKADSLQYELKVCSFDTGSVKQYILWRNDLKKLIISQNLDKPVTSLPWHTRSLKVMHLLSLTKICMSQLKKVTVPTRSAWKDLPNMSFHRMHSHIRRLGCIAVKTWWQSQMSRLECGFQDSLKST